MKTRLVVFAMNPKFIYVDNYLFILQVNFYMSMVDFIFVLFRSDRVCGSFTPNQWSGENF